MIDLIRDKRHRSVLQKNISSEAIIESYLDVVQGINSGINYEEIKEQLREKNIYRGRSDLGSISTMGVRMSEMCFYMFGYKVGKVFVPSPMTDNLLKAHSSVSREENSLVNLFSMQFPHPYSKGTATHFELYFGRLIVKLLLDERIGRKLYIDELIWFIPFIDSINAQKYEELIESILEYRKYSYEKKMELFYSIPEYDQFMATTLHEFKYYFLSIFEGFGVFKLVREFSHNGGKVVTFVHPGTSGTPRYDNVGESVKGQKYSGYFTLNDSVVESAIKLNNKFSAFDKPTTMNSVGINSKQDWLTALYDTEPLEYLSTISSAVDKEKMISDTINTMVYLSKFGKNDGKDFENSLKPFMELFRETLNVEIISGAGNTDLLCAMEDADESIYKLNVDAKKRKGSVSELNGPNLEKHLNKHGAKFCIVVAPRFASGVEYLINGFRVVMIRAEDFGSYCYKECKNSADGLADFESIHQIIKNNLGTDITQRVRNLTQERYGIVL